MYDASMSPADMAAVMNGNNYNDGFGGGAWWWIIILFLFGMNGGWGRNFGGNNGGDGTYSEVQRGFDQNAVMSGINGLNSSINGIQTSLCNGFAGVNSTVADGFAQAEIANNARQMADMQNDFAIQSCLQNCCCENRAAVADLKYTVATEACADRAAVEGALRDVTAQGVANTTALMNSINGGIQAIKDQLCNDKIDAKNERIAELQQQLYMKDLAASQTAQTAAILANNAAQTSALEQYLNPAPIPAYVVQNPNCCTGNYGCGCGM